MGPLRSRYNQERQNNPTPMNPLNPYGSSRGIYASPTPKKPSLNSLPGSGSSMYNSMHHQNNLSFRNGMNKNEFTPLSTKRYNKAKSNIATPNRVLIDRIAEQSGFRTSQLADMNESFLDISGLSLHFGSEDQRNERMHQTGNRSNTNILNGYGTRRGNQSQRSSVLNKRSFSRHGNRPNQAFGDARRNQARSQAKRNPLTNRFRF